jgi:non-heme chloroperoxidase
MPYFTIGQENADDIYLHYEDHGEGKPIVLIHGFPLSGAAWEKELPVLLGAGYRVILYDRRGFGKSSQPSFGYDYDTFASDLDKLLTQLDIRDATLVGHSMGTGEVVRYLSKFGSDRISRAVAICPIPPFLLKTEDNKDGVDKSTFDNFQKLIRLDRPSFLTIFFQSFFNYDVTKGNLVSREAFRLSWNIGTGASPIATHDCVSTWLTDFRADLPKIDVPLLIIHGTADRILPYNLTAAKLQKAVPKSRLVTVEGGSHALPWTHADLINRELLSFMEQKTEEHSAA